MDAESLIQGKSDQHINDTGKEQALEAAKALQDKGINMIMSSPQTHTLETAEIVAEQLGIDKNTVAKGAMFKERDFGDYEGCHTDEVDMFILNSWAGNVPIPNGETIKETAGRVYKQLSNVTKLFKARTVLLVVPKNVLIIISWYFSGLPAPGKELALDSDGCIFHEFDTETIPPEMLDYQTLIDDQKADNVDRVLSQNEIDALIANLESA